MGREPSKDTDGWTADLGDGHLGVEDARSGTTPAGELTVEVLGLSRLVSPAGPLHEACESSQKQQIIVSHNDGDET